MKRLGFFSFAFLIPLVLTACGLPWTSGLGLNTGEKDLVYTDIHSKEIHLPDRNDPAAGEESNPANEADNPTRVLQGDMVKSAMGFNSHPVVVRPEACSVPRAFGSDALMVDLNSDGKMDLLTPTPGSNIAWHQNDEPTQNIITGAYRPRHLHAADIDNDGDVDVFSVSLFTDRLVWHENDGNEVFTNHDLVAYDSDMDFFNETNGDLDGPHQLTTADINNDGHLDILVASTLDRKITLLRNNGDRSFTRITVANNATGVRALAAADLDNDGHLDIVASSGPNTAVSWYQNEGDDNFSYQEISEAIGNTFYVATEDMDADGDMDILAANPNGISWYENKNDNTFALHRISIEGFSGRALAAADLDLDGDLDLVSIGTPSEGTTDVYWHQNDGEQSFETHELAHNTDGAYNLKLGDMDQDGDMDLLVAANTDLVTWYENTVIAP